MLTDGSLGTAALPAAQRVGFFSRKNEDWLARHFFFFLAFLQASKCEEAAGSLPAEQRAASTGAIFLYCRSTAIKTTSTMGLETAGFHPPDGKAGWIPRALLVSLPIT